MKPQALIPRFNHVFSLMLVCLALILSVVPVTQAKSDEPREQWNGRIRPANSAPVIEQGAESVAVTMSEDSSPLPFDLYLSAIDPDRDPLSWSISKPPVYGVARLSGSGNTIALAYKSVSDYFGQDNFVVLVTDKFGNTDSIDVKINILPVEDAPNSQDVAATIAENTTVNFAITDFLFIDPDEGDSLQAIQITREPTVGTLFLDANANTLPDKGEQVIQDQVIPIDLLNTLKFAPDGYGVPYTAFAFLVNDGKLAADYESLMTVNVTHANVAPINTLPADQTVSPDTDLPSLIFSITDVDDTGADNFGLTLTALHGTLRLSTLDGLLGSGNATSILTYNGTLANLNTALNGVTYRGLPGYVGPDTILLASHDQAVGDPLTTTNGVIVMVLNTNHAPVINGDPVVTVIMSEDSEPTPFALTLNASDIDGDILTWSLATPPGQGQAIVRGIGNSQNVAYRAYGDYAGTDSFVVRVQDDWGGAAEVTVNVVIEPVADAPQSADARVSTSLNTDANLATAIPYADADGDALYSVRITLLPTRGTLYLDRNTNSIVDDGETLVADQTVLAADLPFLMFKPAPDESGTDYATIFFLVNDGLLDADYESQLIIDVAAEFSPSPIQEERLPRAKPILNVDTPTPIATD